MKSGKTGKVNLIRKCSKRTKYERRRVKAPRIRRYWYVTGEKGVSENK